MRMRCADDGAPAWSALNTRLRPLPCQSQYAMHREQRCHRASRARPGRDAAPMRAKDCLLALLWWASRSE